MPNRKKKRLSASAKRHLISRLIVSIGMIISTMVFIDTIYEVKSAGISFDHIKQFATQAFLFGICITLLGKPSFFK